MRAVGAIAERFVARLAAIAQRDTVARLERLAIRALDRDPAGYPQRTGDGAIRRDFDGFCNLLLAGPAQLPAHPVRDDKSEHRMGSARPWR